MKKTNWLSRIFSCFWLKSHECYSPAWDMHLNSLIDNAKVTEINDFIMVFDNEYVVWINNHPYASGHLYDIKSDPNFNFSKKFAKTCSIKTKIRLEDLYFKLLKDFDNQKEIFKLK
jgi:hypothetical protein